MSVTESVHRLALHVFRVLPTVARRRVVRTIAPSYTVGAMCVIERADGAILLVRHSYRKRWGVPGGLLKRGEDAAVGAQRETFEETGLAVEVVGDMRTQIDEPAQRIDLLFRAKPVDEAATNAVRPASAEIEEVRWFARDALPDLQFETEGALRILGQD